MQKKLLHCQLLLLRLPANGNKLWAGAKGVQSPPPQELLRLWQVLNVAKAGEQEATQ